MPMMWQLSESTETRLSSGACPVFIAPCVLALPVLESDHLREAEFGTDCSKKHSCERLIPGYMCIPSAQESVQLSRLLNALLSLCENAVNSGLA